MIARTQFDQIVAALCKTSFASEILVVGSTCLFVLAPDIPPSTLDVDIAIPEERILAAPSAVLEGMSKAAFQRAGQTATWVLPGVGSCDLLAYSAPGAGDRVGGREPLKSLVFDDLCRVIARSWGAQAGPGNLQCLSPAAFCATKLATLRMEKGAKDKIQALSLIGKLRTDLPFERILVEALRSLDPMVREDLLADCQMALALSQGRFSELDPYSSFLPLAQEGFRLLARLEVEFR